MCCFSRLAQGLCLHLFWEENIDKHLWLHWFHGVNNIVWCIGISRFTRRITMQPSWTYLKHAIAPTASYFFNRSVQQLLSTHVPCLYTYIMNFQLLFFIYFAYLFCMSMNWRFVSHFTAFKVFVQMKNSASSRGWHVRGQKDTCRSQSVCVLISR